MDSDEAWRRRIEWKLDRLAYHVTCLALAARTPRLPSLPPPRRRQPALADRRPPAGQLPPASAWDAVAARAARAGAAVGSIARRVLNRANGIVFRDALALTLYAVLALTVVGALAGIV